MRSYFEGPVNIGSDEMVTINNLVDLAKACSKKNVEIIHIDGPQGVRGRNSDNQLIHEKLGWRPSQSLRTGIEKTYFWISDQIKIKTT
jgi:nucleoside-diphosphate-sugar epimerase